ncbi:MAG: zinc ribbon domain-containing protein, partial [Thermoplasmata archaeon]|nr:zinc ribbon domain-containing protein [Thermoplasmata archaeon]
LGGKIMTSAPGSTASRNCVSCGRAISWDANVCPYCGHDFRVAMAGPAAMQKKETSMPLIAGILLILCSLGYLAMGAWMAVAGASFMGIIDEAGGAMAACGGLVAVLGILVLLGGVFSIQKKHFGLALVASIIALPTVLGIVALILIIVSKDEFT